MGGYIYGKDEGHLLWSGKTMDGLCGGNIYRHLAIFRINYDTHLRARLRRALWRGFIEEGRPSLSVGDVVL